MLTRFCALLILLIAGAVHAITITGIPNSHDPATLIKDGNTYFHFTTGDGIWYSRSTNLTHWGSPATVFPVGTWPAWINTAVPGFSGHFWAPDVIYMNDHYYLYYSVSTFGSSRSAIGVVRTPSLLNPVWQDLGMVVSSNGTSGAINAIDPALLRDDDGRVYMSYGSWFGGIGVVEIDTDTGMALGSVTPIYGGGHQSIEAPYIIKEGDYYYLYVNRGTCCAGLDSGYYIEVGRATSIYGPYSGWRTVLPNREGRYHGPGHVGLLQEDGCNYVSIHYYDVQANGAAKLDILSMTYGADGWPQFTRDFTVGNCPVAPPGEEPDGGAEPVLKARYSFDNTLADSWGNYADGVVIGNRVDADAGGSVTYTSGAWAESQALTLDGFTGVRLPQGLIASEHYSVSLWLHPDNLNQYSTAFFGARNPDSWISLVPWGPGAGNTMLWAGSNLGTGWHDAEVGLRIPAGEWSHLAFAVSGSDIAVYLNGELRYSASDFPVIFTAGDALFALGVNYWDQPYAGLMDELRIYAGALTAEQVALLADPDTAALLPDLPDASSSSSSSADASSSSSTPSSVGASSAGSVSSHSTSVASSSSSAAASGDSSSAASSGGSGSLGVLLLWLLLALGVGRVAGCRPHWTPLGSTGKLRH